MEGMSRLHRNFTVWSGFALLIFLMFTPAATAQDAADATSTVKIGRPDIPPIWWLAPAMAVVALVFAVKFYKEVLAADEGDPLMIKIAGYVRDGAMAYLTSVGDPADGSVRRQG